jgi:D-glycerate 3-kinase
MSDGVTNSAALAATRELIAEQHGGRLWVVGLAGAQGSGKSTLAAALAATLAAEGVATAVLSIDDLYRTRAERLRLARDVHPLLITRGPPGTHDVELGVELIAALETGRPAALPRFSKAADDRLPEAEWPRAPAGTRVLLLEGWCVGAKPQAEADLAAPINALEHDEDADGRWRRWCNAALAGDYQRLFARIDRLAMLRAPDWGVVAGWRAEQEQELADRAMPPAALARFVAHYERLTRHMLAEMPARADLLLDLDRHRRVVAIARRRA